jgi:protein SCO1/2
MRKPSQFGRPIRAAVIAAAAWILPAGAEGDVGAGTLPHPRSTDFALTDVRGRTVTAADFRGRSMLVYFGYTRCPDVCPLGLRNIGAALEFLGDEANRMETVFISLDSYHDTPQRVAAFIAKFRPGMVGLTGDKRAVFQAARNYGVRYRATRGEAAAVSHVDYVFYIGPDGSSRDVLPGALAPEQMAARIRSATPALSLQTAVGRHRDTAGSAELRSFHEK